MLAPCRVEWIHDRERFRSALFDVVDAVSYELGLGTEPAHLMDSGSGSLGCLFAQLNLITPTPVIAANGSHLVNAAQRWFVVGRDQFRADSPNINHGTLFLETFND